MKLLTHPVWKSLYSLLSLSYSSVLISTRSNIHIKSTLPCPIPSSRLHTHYLPCSVYANQNTQFMQVVPHYPSDTNTSRYSQLPPQATYSLLPQTSPFFVMNSPRGIPGQVVDRTRELQNPYMALNLPGGNSQPNTSYMTWLFDEGCLLQQTIYCLVLEAACCCRRISII